MPELPDQTGRPHAVDLIIELVRASPGEVSIVAIGPQTNLALALLKEPRLRDEIASIVFMGGALGLDPKFGRGNITPVAECNIWFDPAAADIVFRSGIALTMVSLDVTNPSSGMLMPEETVRAVDERRSPLAALFVEVCSTYLEAPMFDWGHGCVLYDPLAVAVTAEPALGTFEPMAVGIETAGRLSIGQTVPLRDRPANVRVMTSVDGRRVVAAMVKTILS